MQVDLPGVTEKRAKWTLGVCWAGDGCVFAVKRLFVKWLIIAILTQ